ncbi:MAG: hypothetical protein IJF53_01345 [Clostridia bacterium]|nr:hypothetical protein [Clostridia bacterium]
MKNTKKALLMTLCAVMLVAASVMGTMAYLTSTTGVVTNTFTVGKVGITLDEAKVTEYGVKDGDTRVMANTYKLVPGHTYVKDPTVHVAALDQDGQLELLSSSIQDKNGKKYIQFKTTHLSTFAIYALGKDGTVQIENGEVNLTTLSGKKDYSPNTGDMSIHPKWFIALGLSAVAIALMTAKPKRKKSKVQ